ncbi:MAG: tRNA 2-thiouridine(34) synthase MnmA [Nitrospirota bacterium]
MPKIVVGMSGGVDSSVSAYLLKEQGYEVEGISLVLWEAGRRTDFSTCCSLQVMQEVSKTCERIGIPHRIIDVRDDFIGKVIEPFVDAYSAGLTPNPCILCNKFIKFPFLLKEAEKTGAELIATGHYARVERKDSGVQGFKDSRESSEFRLRSPVFLKKGIDPKKDQSYVLYILGQKELRKLILPLGHYRKEEVRKMAQELGLPAAERSESQEICFIEERNYFKFIEKLSPIAGKPGPILDLAGKAIGTHKGIHGYTIGQRKGLGISFPEPFYVARIDALKNTIHVGPQEAAKKREFLLGDLNWIVPPPADSFKASVKIRSTMKDQLATIFLVKNQELQVKNPTGVRVVFDDPQWAPAPGQSAVFYDGDIVIGGGVIKISA